MTNEELCAKMDAAVSGPDPAAAYQTIIDLLHQAFEEDLAVLCPCSPVPGQPGYVIYPGLEVPNERYAIIFTSPEHFANFDLRSDVYQVQLEPRKYRELLSEATKSDYSYDGVSINPSTTETGDLRIGYVLKFQKRSETKAKAKSSHSKKRK